MAGGFAERLSAIKAPTLVVATDDPFLPPAFLRQAVVSLIRGARLAVLPGPGHYVQVERPRETAALLEAFLAGLSAT
jgi:non-heme chloroperoxidase